MIERWTVTCKDLISNYGTLSYDGFEYLTGKKINWKKRIGKDVISLRDRGHIRLYDSKFIKGETYKHRSGTYQCTYVADDGEALLNKNGTNMIVKYANNPFVDKWEVA